MKSILTTMLTRNLMLKDYNENPLVIMIIIMIILFISLFVYWLHFFTVTKT